MSRPRAAISASARVNRGHGETADVFIAISDIDVDTTEEEIDEAIDATKLAWRKVVAKLRVRTKQLREENLG
jgi:hypothetical protein